MEGCPVWASDRGSAQWPSNGAADLTVENLREDGSPKTGRRGLFCGSGRLTVVIRARRGPTGRAFRTECHAREHRVPRTDVVVGLL